MVASPDERSVIARARSGDEEAFRRLIGAYKGDVLNLAWRILRNREDAEDATQEVFLRVYRSLDTFDPERVFRSWILRITHNLCIDHLRRRRVKTVSIDEPVRLDEGDVEWDLPDREATDALEAVIAKEERERIEEAIASLSATLRSAITLRHLHGLRYEEIAGVLQIPLGTVKVRIFRARAAIAAALARRSGGREE